MAAKIALFEATYNPDRFFNYRLENKDRTACGIASLTGNPKEISNRLIKVLEEEKEVIIGTCLPPKIEGYEHHKSSSDLIELVASDLRAAGARVIIEESEMKFNYQHFR